MKSLPVAVVAGCLAVLMLAGAACTTKKTLTRDVVTHDTLVIHHTDTLRLSSHHAKADTLRETIVRVVTLRQDSARTDTVRVETFRDRWRSVAVVDSARSRRSQTDTLRAVSEDRSVEKRSSVVQGGASAWRVVLLRALVLVLLVVVAALAWRLLRLSK